MKAIKKILLGFSALVLLILGIIFAVGYLTPDPKSVNTVTSPDGKHVVDIYDFRILSINTFQTSVDLGERETKGQFKKEEPILEGTMSPYQISVIWEGNRKIRIKVPSGKVETKVEKFKDFEINYVQ